jgi:uncharacterized LabA/DUF88 family protein
MLSPATDIGGEPGARATRASARRSPPRASARQTVAVADASEPRVGIYIDFDNIVISRYNQLFGRGAFQRDKVRDLVPKRPDADPDTVARLASATIDVSAVLDFASSFGTVVVSRAYADWSMPVNSGYRQQLVARAVDLTQLFQTTRGAKNGADIRLAVDVVEDLFRLEDLTTVVIVAGDSDYIPLTQKAKRLGRYVVGIGVAGATSTSLAAACDQFADYDDLPGVERPIAARAAEPIAAATARPEGGAGEAGDRARSAGSDVEPDVDDEPEPTSAPDPQATATDLLVRALRVGHARDDTDEWLHAASVKNQMRRLDPSFSERPLGFRSFTDFIKSRADVVELGESGQERMLRLRE